MPSSYSPLGFVLQATGENETTWGDFLNSGGLSLIDDAIRGRVAFTLNGTKTLTSTNGVDTEARKAILHITGGIGGTVVIPNYSKTYLVINEASGDVVVTAGGAMSATVATGETTVVVSEGSNVRTLQIGGMGLKAYIDAQAFSAANLPGITPGTAGQSVTNDGVIDFWGDVFPPLRRSTRTSNTMLGVADRGKLIDVTAGSFTQTVDTVANLVDGWHCLYRVSGTGQVTFGSARINTGELYLIQSDGLAINVVPLKKVAGPHLVVQERRSSGTAPATPNVAATWNARALDTVLENREGATFSSGRPTLQPGRHKLKAWGGAVGVGPNKIRIYDVTNGVVVAYGSSAYSPNLGLGSGLLIQGPHSVAEVIVTLSAATTYELQHYIASIDPGVPGFSGWMGVPTGDGSVETYSQFSAELQD